jgi:hypothetical protein
MTTASDCSRSSGTPARQHCSSARTPQFSGVLLQQISLARVARCADYAQKRLSASVDDHAQLVRSDQRNGGPRAHRSTDQSMTQAVRDVRREGRGNSQTEQPPGERWNRQISARRVEHHHRTGVDQTVHSQRNETSREASLTVRRHKIARVLAGDDSRNADHGPGSGPPNQQIRRAHHAPTTLSVKSVVRAMGVVYVSCESPPRIQKPAHFPRILHLLEHAAARSPPQERNHWPAWSSSA